MEKLPSREWRRRREAGKRPDCESERRPVTLVELPSSGGRRRSPRVKRGEQPRGDGVWVLFENSTVCFVCDSAKFFVWLRPFHIPVVGVAFLFEQPVFGLFLLGLCFS